MVLIVIFKYENGIIYIMALNQQVMDSNYQRRLDIQNLRRIMSYGRPASSEKEK